MRASATVVNAAYRIASIFSATTLLAIAFTLVTLIDVQLSYAQPYCGVTRTRQGVRCTNPGAKCDDGGGAGICANLSDEECDCVVTNPPGINMTVSPMTPASVVRGAVGNATVTITPVNGFRDDVILSCSITLGGAPDVSTCSFPGANPVRGGSGSALLEADSSKQTPGGTYSVTVVAQASSGGTVGSQTVPWTILVPPGVGNFCPIGTCDISQPIYMNVYWDTSPEQWDLDAGPGLKRADIDQYVTTIISSSYFTGLKPYNVTSIDYRPSITVSTCGPVPNDIDQALAEMGKFADCVMFLVNSAAPNYLDPNAAILNVFLPPQTVPSSPTADFCAKYAGEHDKFGSSVEVTVIPTATACNPSDSAVFATLSHEMVEATTDPIAQSPTGWKQPSWQGGQEIADICDSLGGTWFPPPDGVVVQYWSNVENNCVTGVDGSNPGLRVLLRSENSSVTPFKPHVVSFSCPNCTTNVENSAVIWTRGDQLDTGNWIAISGADADVLKDRFDVGELAVAPLAGHHSQATLFGGGTKAEMKIIGPVVSITLKGQSADMLAKITEPCTLSLAIPNGASRSNSYHILHLIGKGDSLLWAEPFKTEIRARGRAATAQVKETGLYALIQIVGPEAESR